MLVWQIVLASRLLAKSQQLHAFLSRGIKLRRHFMPGSHVTAGSKDITKVITRVISRVSGTNIWLGSKLKPLLHRITSKTGMCHGVQNHPRSGK